MNNLKNDLEEYLERLEVRLLMYQNPLELKRSGLEIHTIHIIKNELQELLRKNEETS